MGSADVQPLTLYELLLFSAAIYGCLHVERNYSLSLLSNLYLTLTITLTLALYDNLWLLTCGTDYSLSLLLHIYLTLTLSGGRIPAPAPRPTSTLT